jgi:hypothetical protein
MLSLPVLLFFAIPDDPRVSKAEFARVQNGMKMAQVEAIFSGPYARYRDVEFWHHRPGVVPIQQGAAVYIWDGYEGHAGIKFDSTGTVVDKIYTPSTPETRRDPVTRRFDRLDEWLRHYRWGVRE